MNEGIPRIRLDAACISHEEIVVIDCSRETVSCSNICSTPVTKAGSNWDMAFSRKLEKTVSAGRIWLE